ncbi:MAG TPA: LysM peptidoglycan-binding domain-containing protein [Pyrinomonadaceae bacterium]|jgi:hypothetical protein
MPESERLEKAYLVELEQDFLNVKAGATPVSVQFNPETLKLSFANQVATPSGAGAGDQKGPAARQYVGSGTTKLSLQLWFDANAPVPPGVEQVDDVRKLTQKVIYFITPQPDPGDKTKMLPPAVRFHWGTFQFDGMMDSVEESIEFFSNDGKSLRASMSLNLSQQKILVVKFDQNQAGAKKSPGTTPLTQAAAGSTLQGLAASLGKGASWQDIASANGIENPRLLQPGQLIDMNVQVKIGG